MQLLCFVLLMFASTSHQLLVDESAGTDDYLNDFLVYPLRSTNIRKREVASQTHDEHDAFVEEKLAQHSQALEQLLRMVSRNSLITRRLMDHLNGTIDKPTMPDDRKFYRRSFDGRVETVPTIKPPSDSPWCGLSLLCHQHVKPVCAFDDNFGYGRFYNLCNMFQVNCYWNYNFSPVKDCQPSI